MNNLSADIVQEPGEELPGLPKMDALTLSRASLDSGNERLRPPQIGEARTKLPKKQLTAVQHKSLLLLREPRIEISHDCTIRVAKRQPGQTITPLLEAPSGHLSIVNDNCTKSPRQG